MSEPSGNDYVFPLCVPQKLPVPKISADAPALYFLMIASVLFGFVTYVVLLSMHPKQLDNPGLAAYRPPVRNAVLAETWSPAVVAASEEELATVPHLEQVASIDQVLTTPRTSATRDRPASRHRHVNNQRRVAGGGLKAKAVRSVRMHAPEPRSYEQVQSYAFNSNSYGRQPQPVWNWNFRW